LNWGFQNWTWYSRCSLTRAEWRERHPSTCWPHSS